MRHLVFAVLCAALLLWPPSIAAQTHAGATLRGTISDDTGTRLDGVQVIVSDETGAGGARRASTNAEGRFAFHALPPGRYLVQVERAGYRTLSDIITLRSADLIVFDAVLERGEPREPMARPRRTIPRSLNAAVATSFDASLLEVLPIESRRASDALALMPGVHPGNQSAYGGAGRSANRYTLDGMPLGDPRGNGVWADGSLQWLRSADVLAHGAGAEFGGYAAVLSDGVLPSGGEHLTGAFELLFANDALTGSNVSQELLDLNPQLREPSRDLAIESSGQLGGALRPGRSWFFAGAQFSLERVTPAGFPPTVEEYVSTSGPSSPSATAIRGVFKPTFAMGAGQHLSAAVAFERLHDNALFAGPRVMADATLDDSTLSLLWSGTYARVLSQRSTLDVRYSGLAGRNEQQPHNGSTPGIFDVAQDVFAVNAVDFVDARRTRHVFGATWSRLLASHTIKAGAEFEISGGETETGYNGGLTIDTIFGVPTFAYTWDGDRRDSTNRRLTAFVHDSWVRGPRLAISAGVRVDRISGSLARRDGSVFDTTSVAPRVGLGWAPGAEGTAVRASYGWYFQGVKSSYYDLLDPGITPVMGFAVDSSLRPLGAPTVIAPGSRHDIDSNLKHPRSQQAAVSYERNVAWQIQVRLAGIYRRSDQFIDDVLLFDQTGFAVRTIEDIGPDGFPGSGDDTGNTVTAYNQLTDPFASRLFITNPEDAVQHYRGFEVAATRRLSDVWQVHASWTLSKTTGNYDNVDALGNTGEYDTPNVDPRLQPLREGRLTNDVTHVAKVFGSYSGPWQITAAVAFYYTSGQAFTRTMRVRFNQGREDLLVEPRGSQRLGAADRLDARVERPFTIGRGRLSVIAEGFNLMNRATITARTAASGGAFLTPEGVAAPRRFRLGAMYRF